MIADFGQMTEAGARACAFVKQMLITKEKTGCLVMHKHYDSARLPMIVFRRSHRKTFRNFVLLLMILPVTSFAITPPGTVISNTATSAYTVGGVPANVNSNVANVTSTIISTPSTISLLQFAPLGVGTVNVDAVTSHATVGPPGSVFVVSANPVVPVAGAPPVVIDPTLPIALNAVDAYHTGEPIFVHIDDQDQNLNPTIREIITVVVNSPATGDEEEITLIETGVNTGEFVGYVQSTPAAPKQRKLIGSPITIPTILQRQRPYWSVIGTLILNYSSYTTSLSKIRSPTIIYLLVLPPTS